jgi:hypothetical protein
MDWRPRPSRPRPSPPRRLCPYKRRRRPFRLTPRPRPHHRRRSCRRPAPILRWRPFRPRPSTPTPRPGWPRCSHNSRPPLDDRPHTHAPLDLLCAQRVGKTGMQRSERRGEANVGRKEVSRRAGGVVQGREADKYSARACGGAAPEGRVEDKSVVLLDEGDEVLGLELEVGLAGPADREARPRLVLEGSIEHVATGRSVSDQIDEEGVRREKRTPNVSILPWQLKFMTLPTALPTSRSNLGSSVSCRPARTRSAHTHPLTSHDRAMDRGLRDGP